MSDAGKVMRTMTDIENLPPRGSVLVSLDLLRRLQKEPRDSRPHGSRMIVETDSVTDFDYDTCNERIFGNGHLDADEVDDMKQYIGDTVMLSDRARLIAAARTFLGATITCREISEAMNLTGHEFRRYLSEANFKLRQAPPRLLLRQVVHNPERSQPRPPACGTEQESCIRVPVVVMRLLRGRCDGPRRDSIEPLSMFPNTADMRWLSSYFDNALNLSVRERIIMVGLTFLVPAPSLRRIGRAMGLAWNETRRYRDRARRKILRAPPRQLFNRMAITATRKAVLMEPSHAEKTRN